jgi:phage tail-like protein
MDRSDPYRSFKFIVEFDMIQRAGFARVKGLGSEIKIDSYHEGGLNEREHKAVSHATQTNLVLERGLADNLYLYEWHQGIVAGQIIKRTLSILLQNAEGREVWRWHAAGAFPVKWTAGDLDAANSQVLIESIEFAHQGIRT